MKAIGRYYLLCDACNWEFTGFAVPGTVSSKPSRRKTRSEKQPDLKSEDNADADKTKNEGQVRTKIRKRVKIKSRI